MGNYAADTDVPVERSRAEIESTLARYNADSFAYGWDQSKAVIQFQMSGRHIRMVLPLPDRNAREYTHQKVNQHAESDKPRTEAAAYKAWEQGCRQKWRALALVIKAKLEAVESGISEFEAEFLAHVVLPDGSTVGESVHDTIEQAYASGLMPTTLLALPGPS